MKRIVIAISVAALMTVSCGDKFQLARTVLSFVGIGIQTADNAFKTASKIKRDECLKLGVEGSPAFTECYKSMAEAEAVFAKVKPNLERSMETAAKYIKAAESGEVNNWAKAVKQSVCLLTEVAKVVPGEWKKKIEAFLDLASAYACDKPVSLTSPQHDLYVLKKAHRLMSEILVGA
jgi:hypothetical protein